MRALRSAALLMLTVATAVALTLLITESDQAPQTYHDTIQATELPAGPKVTSGRLRRAFKIGERYWSTSRCRSIAHRRRSLDNPRRIAQASWRVEPGGRYTRCVVTFNADHARLAFRVYCAAMIHELGHLAGFHEVGGLDSGTHAASSHSVMYPRISAANVPQVCRRARDRGL